MITIITPTFNTGRFLPHCIASVRQCLEGYDYVHHLYDDGSDDLKSLQVEPSARLRLSRSKENLGLGGAVAELLAMVETPWCIWLNADDYLLPGVRRLVEVALRSESLDAVYGSTQFVSLTQEPIRILSRYPSSVRSMLQSGTYGAPSSGIFRTRSVRNPDVLRPYTMLLDICLWLQISENGAPTCTLKSLASAMTRRSDQLSANIARPSESIEFDRLRDDFPLIFDKVESNCARNRFKVDHRLRKLFYGSYIQEIFGQQTTRRSFGSRGKASWTDER